MNIGALREILKNYADDTPCSYDLWLPNDVRDLVAAEMPDESPITDAEIEDTLDAVFRRRDAEYGTTWQTIKDCLPDSVTDRMM
jgi:hypothetical protein